jgi:RNA polymerase sigma factor (sigma-70 family)
VRQPHTGAGYGVYPVMEMKKPFEQVVTDYGAAVLRVCRALLGPHADADDAWSETFLAALRAYPQLPAGANLEAWLLTIAHHKVIDITRARQRRAVPVADVPERAAADDRSAHVEHAELWRALATLPRKQREALAYRYLGGLAYRDIAEIIGGSADAARRAAADGIKALRKNHTLR